MAEQSGLRGYRFPPGRQEGQREEEGGSLSPLSVMFKRWLGGIATCGSKIVPARLKEKDMWSIPHHLTSNTLCERVKTFDSLTSFPCVRLFFAVLCGNWQRQRKDLYVTQAPARRETN